MTPLRAARDVTFGTVKITEGDDDWFPPEPEARSPTAEPP